MREEVDTDIDTLLVIRMTPYTTSDVQWTLSVVWEVLITIEELYVFIIATYGAFGLGLNIVLVKWEGATLFASMWQSTSQLWRLAINKCSLDDTIASLLGELIDR